MADTIASDIIIVGGGLAGCLTAMRLCQLRPDKTVTLIERRDEVGGDQLWSFHETDLPPGALSWMEPMVLRRWAEQDVIFPQRRRSIATPYVSMSSASLRQEVEKTPGLRIATGINTTEIGANEVLTASGERFSAPLVLNATGLSATSHADTAYQKFVGVVSRIKGGHGITRPVIMDATVEQIDGFRFIYLLPFDDERIMIEDTRYSDTPIVDVAHFEAAIADYMSALGWEEIEREHTEKGVLPITLAFDAAAFWAGFDGAVPIGMNAGLFHATTGYSLPLAVQTAELIAGQETLTSEAILPQIREFAIAHARRQWFFRYLNRMLFKGCPPERRWFIMQRFYGLGQSLIERFYADRLFWRDRLRVLSGKPPIPVREGVRCIPERHGLAAVA